MGGLLNNFLEEVREMLNVPKHSLTYMHHKIFLFLNLSSSCSLQLFIFLPLFFFSDSLRPFLLLSLFFFILFSFFLLLPFSTSPSFYAIDLCRRQPRRALPPPSSSPSGCQRRRARVFVRFSSGCLLWA
ncbi:unnamed protein product [Cuscuta europaea]|uniref:Uncharacterized protein n=1 Tax=Cuscuta europaea TaxID=41803 RepID=A0A9P0ZUT2_CUSEU|nr:unnamed protein product [Cuscuta europaea]